MNVLILTLMVSAVFEFGCMAETLREKLHKGRNEWRRILCERRDDALTREIDECHKPEQREVHQVLQNCANQVSPSTRGIVQFVSAGCADKTIFEKFDACVAPYEDDENFLKQLKRSNETKACLKQVARKYNFGIENLNLE